MTFKEIQELVKLINKSDLTEFKMKDGEFELSIRTKHYEKTKQIVKAAAQPQQPVVAVQPPVQQTFPPPAQPSVPPAEKSPEEQQPAPAQQEEGEETTQYKEIRSPIVGTFYRSPSPEKAPYVKVGDTVEVGTVVCIVEAMKLFNEIESEITGKIVKVMVEDAQPVEYDQVLFLVDPKG
jgi:acetyl-CoA carboxylase biotin carboxyl carrier protein